jgi:hypothetical protein
MTGLQHLLLVESNEQTSCKEAIMNTDSEKWLRAMKSIQILLATNAFHDDEIWQMDVGETVFPKGNLQEVVYMTLPKGFTSSEHAEKVCSFYSPSMN